MIDNEPRDFQIKYRFLHYNSHEQFLERKYENQDNIC